jgi:hypothetical protein
MIQQTTGIVKSFKAGAAIAKNTIVMFGADDEHVIVATAATDKLIGVALSAAAAAEEVVEVQLSGVTEVKLGGTVTRGDSVTSGAAGVGVALAAAATIKCSIGEAMASGVTGDIIPVRISTWCATTA